MGTFRRNRLSSLYYQVSNFSTCYVCSVPFRRKHGLNLISVPHPQPQKIAAAIRFCVVLESGAAVQYETVVDELHVTALHLKGYGQPFPPAYAFEIIERIAIPRCQGNTGRFVASHQIEAEIPDGKCAVVTEHGRENRRRFARPQ